VKNGAELLDRLIKDIVSESASTFVSALSHPEKEASDEASQQDHPHTAFSLARFIPLLQERITVIHPYTRMFLVSWITLLDSIPDLELVSFLPSFLAGLFRFLSDVNQDVHTATQIALERFLAEIRKIAQLKRGIAESKRNNAEFGTKRSGSSIRSDKSPGSISTGASGREKNDNEGETSDDDSVETDTANDGASADGEEDWVPGQDVVVDHTMLLEILVAFLGSSSGA
jgi:vacuole morphology and inheritance protein 14